MNAARTEAVLFDIDGTLISTGGASNRAWKRAFKELHDVDLDVPALTGKGVPDPEVGRQCFVAALGREPTGEEAAALMRRRLDHLPEEVENSPGFVVKDGVVELLDRLIDDGVTLGLTTGNVEEAAHIKLARANLNRFFSFGGYGSDSADRGELTRKAIDRAGEILGSALDSRRVLVVGDTPNDIAAAHAAGAVGIGVASGHASKEELHGAGADYVLGSLLEELPGVAEPVL